MQSVKHTNKIQAFWSQTSRLPQLGEKNEGYQGKKNMPKHCSIIYSKSCDSKGTEGQYMQKQKGWEQMWKLKRSCVLYCWIIKHTSQKANQGGGAPPWNQPYRLIHARRSYLHRLRKCRVVRSWRGASQLFPAPALTVLVCLSFVHEPGKELPKPFFLSPFIVLH